MNNYFENNLQQLEKLIVQNLSDDLLSKKWLNQKRMMSSCHPTFGHCYIATEAAYHLLGGKKKGWTSHYLKCEEGSHWFLKHASGIIFDITAEQFENEEIFYNRAIGKGFLTKQPSKRANFLIDRVLSKNYHNLTKII